MNDDPVERQLEERLERAQRDLDERRAAKQAWDEADDEDALETWRAWLRKAARAPSEKERGR